LDKTSARNALICASKGYPQFIGMDVLLRFCSLLL